MTQLARIIHNPMSRNSPSPDRLAALCKAAPDGWTVDLVTTEASGHAVALAREAVADGASAAFACGGDGTINEVVNGLAGNETALGVLRGGMGDVFAREVGIPRAPEKALAMLLAGDRRCFDLGMANERYFLLMAGVGFDAAVVRFVPSQAKRRLGSTSYALWGARVLAGYHPSAVSLALDGDARSAELFWLLVSNTRSYGGVIDVARDARVDDGMLDAYMLEGHGYLWEASTVVKLALGRREGTRGLTARQLRELVVETPGLPVQLDGEYVGDTPMRFSVVPQSLQVLLPRGRGLELFSQEGRP